MSFREDAKGNWVELTFAKHLLKGIREIHAVGLVHRDLKPQNLFVTRQESDGKVEVLKIGDFGLARLADGARRECGTVGTPAYSAPEGGADAGAPADIYAAALIMMELLSPPLGTEMARAKLLEGFRGRHELPAHVTKHLPGHAKLLVQMAQRRPEDRPTAEQAHAELKRLGLSPSPQLHAMEDPMVMGAEAHVMDAYAS